MSAKPINCKKLEVEKLTTNFREAVSIKTADKCSPKENEVCIRNKFVGINATDVNMTKGRYFVSAKPPYGVGLEGVGEVVEVGEKVSRIKPGQSVAYLNSRCNSYAEYVCIAEEEVFEIPEVKPDYLALLISGLTAAISLDKAARVMAGETVLITAAAGGTGHIAVQWAKAADCHVIGTCSSEEKEKILKELGCDRVINYRKESIAEVLANEYKNGVDVVWETIGGEVLQTCVKNLSIKGRLLVVGSISGYKNEDAGIHLASNLSYLPGLLLMKSAAMQGFLLFHYKECFQTYFKYLTESIQSGKLKIIYDDGKKTTGSEFLGMEGIINGVEHLHNGKNLGKVVARIS